jgi:hypothetical protein
MSRAIEKKRLKVGHKLSICGARLTDQSEPISPLDQLDEEGACKLIISSNSCMPVSWDTKLGIQKRALVCRPIHSLFDDGGMVTMLDVTLCRKYPMMYMEVLPNKQNVHRTAREEEELVYGNRMPNFKAEKSIEAKTNQVDERRVSGYFKIKVCDSKGASSGFANILISNANEVIYMDLKEGARYRVSFLLPRPQKYNQQLQLKTINTMTRWEPLKMPSHTTAYIPRSLTLASAIKESSSNGYEIDIVACVLSRLSIYI